ADGWLPSLSYLQGGIAQLPDLNARIDEAAAAAGRDPRSVRRLLNISGEFSDNSSGLLNGPVGQWAEELAGLALDSGISGFILMGDDPAVIRRFGQEVAPAVRDLVAAERADPGGGNKSGEDGAIAGTRSASAHGNRPAPESGEGQGASRFWDETARPVAPPAPPGHQYSARGRAVSRHLAEVHDHLRQELDQIRDLLEQVKQGSMSAGAARAALNKMTLRQNNWTLGAYCAAYCSMITAHHGLEDRAVFPHLREADPGLVPVIDRLEHEHVIIHEVVEGVDKALVELVARPDDFSDLQAAIDALTGSLRSHLAYEEQQITEPLSRFGFFAGQV
ncbi:MAG TPA: hemerythrin domain-containing protein, partial [Streptosporangiaceae bacterium]